MMIGYPSPEFDAAVAAVCHGSADDAQVRAIYELLRRDPVARDEYILRLELHARLASDPALFASSAEQTVPLPMPRPVEAKRPRWTSTAWVWALAAACVMLLTAGAWFFLRSPSDVRAVGTSKAVAVLNRVAGAVWQGTQENPRLGAPLEPGWFRLQSGLAEIVLYDGARLVIEGPAELQLISPSEVVCAKGRLIAEVPPPAKGFRIRTSHLSGIDRGAFFGVEVSGGQSELHVFQGAVDVESGRGVQPRAVLEGTAIVASDRLAEEQRMPANRRRFASLLDLRNKSSERMVARREQWRSDVRKQAGDSSLLVHFDFEAGAEFDWRLRNVGKRSDVAPDGAVIGCQWADGRWGGKQGMEFRAMSDRVRLEVAGEYDSITLAAWVRVHGLDREINSLFMSDGFDAGTLHWCIRRDGVLGVTVIGAEPGHFQICASPPAVTLDQIGLWSFLAVVIDGESRRVTHFVNGESVSGRALKISPPFRVGAAELGNWNARGFSKNDPFMIRNFSGVMDEFFLFGRALSSEEIRDLYSAGKP